ncbi:MAG: pseudouridine synthase [Sphingomonadales bacterium]|nr:MAG: pseudouridine synthase [Sphingomonadales bacterium]
MAQAITRKTFSGRNNFCEKPYNRYIARVPPSKTNEPAREGQRIAKLLARAGIASRREIERMIADGRVALDGKTLDTPATVLTSLDGVTVDGNPVEAPEAARLFRYHKSAGLLTAERDFTGRMTIYDRMPAGLPRVMPVGRLDLNTEGLLLLTTDGELKRQLELPSSGVERSYRARAYGPIAQEQLEDLMLGVEIEGVRYGPINANIERRTGANVWIEMTLTEGKNREVRRVLEYLGLEVSRLIRTRYGPFWLGDLPIGDVDEIRQNDLATFRTVLSKPGGGKAASNLQFAVRQRVPAAPKPQAVPTGREPDSQRSRVRPAPRPRAAEPVERFAPRAAPPRTDRPRREDAPDRRPPARGTAAGESRFAPRGAPPRTERPVREDASGRRAPARGAPAGESRFAPRGAPPRDERPAREDSPVRRGPARGAPAGESRFTPRGAPPRAERPAREEAPARRGPARGAPAGEARFTPRVTPGRAPDRPSRPERPARDDTIANPARAARSRAHRDTLEPRAPRPTGGDRPTKGPSGGRGKPSRPGKPGKPARPPRTRK